MTYSDNKRDKNEAEIVDFWRRAGCIWIPMSRLAGFDGLLIDGPVINGYGIYIVEIKQPGKQLTEAERNRRDEIEEVGCDYHIIHNLQEAAELIGLKLDE